MPRGAGAATRRRATRQRGGQGAGRAPAATKSASLTAGATTFKDYPLSGRDATWDAGEASKRWQDACGIGGDSPDWTKFHTGFFWFDADKAETVGAHKLGFVDVVDGTATAIWKGVTASAGAVQGARGGVQIPDGDVAGVKAHIAKYYDKAAKEYDDDGIQPPWEADSTASIDQIDFLPSPAAVALAYAELGPGVGATDHDLGEEQSEFVALCRFWDATDSEVALDGMRERLQHTVRCDCGHAYSEHLGTSGPCTHEDGRGTCRCGGFAEAAVEDSAQSTADGLVAAAGDLVWGPEDGFQDLLCDVNDALREMGVYGYCACDATVDLTRVLVCDWDMDECWVVPITVGADREPVLGPQEEWVMVEPGWVEVEGEDGQYAARIEAARMSAPEQTGEEIAVSRMRLHLTSLRAAGDAVELLPEHQPQDVRPDAHATPAEPAAVRGPFEWDAIFAVEGSPTDDFRLIAPGALTWRELPLSLGAMLDTPHADVVMNSEVCGRIDRIWRDEAVGLIRASGVFDDGEYGSKIAGLVTDGTLRGISVDLAIKRYEVGPWSNYLDEDGLWAPKDQGREPSLVDLLSPSDEPQIAVIMDAVIGATTICPFPAFAEAKIEIATSLVAGGSPAFWTVTSPHGFRVVARKPPRPRPGEALTASAAGMAPDAPPAGWFDDPHLDGPTALTVTEDGRIFGHAATWDTCHIAFADTCVTPPASETDYAYYLLGEVVCDDGTRIPCGQITLGTGHASLNVGRAAAAAHYDDTGLAAADVTVGEDDFGIWVAGAVRPGVDSDRVRELRGAKLSGDWRRIDDGGPLELVALLAVNVPGFPVPRAPRAVVASGEDGEQVVALVAAGIPGGLTDADRERLSALAASAAGCNCVACAAGTRHASDCAVHNEPALPAGPCDCGEGE